jgi:hypothetical protein
MSKQESELTTLRGRVAELERKLAQIEGAQDEEENDRYWTINLNGEEVRVKKYIPSAHRRRRRTPLGLRKATSPYTLRPKTEDIRGR